jgi:6-phosphogluconolactonase
MTHRRVQIFQTKDTLFSAAADSLRDLALQAVEDRGRFLLVLSGGSTPRPLYELLSRSPYDTQIPWQKTHVFWGDERAVEPDDAQSNYGQAYELLLKKVDVPADHVHRIRGEVPPAEAARAYADELMRFGPGGRPWPRFDLVLLGMGSDGHTASLFPGSTHPLRETQSTLAVTGSYGDRPSGRVTLTPPIFNSARHIHFLVTGAEKAETLARVLNDKKNRVRLPAQRIQPDEGQVTWFVDREAASRLDPR